MVCVEGCVTLGYFTVGKVALDLSQINDQVFGQVGFFVVGKKDSKMVILSLHIISHFVSQMAETRK